ncbi:hypothetical protein ABM34_07450 [Companilactobacillus ginsenosidimutans]|uniref:PIN domain-containing protein n=1 Tax=Companilactobacillus ginsenosidimutans TaxID=1007676 RepID=A0A0H4QL16_9LACO|nr:hypothetical protein ABM34_07450 [Companilactobacillus ginsenosidimutans]
MLYLIDSIQQKNDYGYSDLIYNSVSDRRVKYLVTPYIISEYINRSYRIAGIAFSKSRNIKNYNYKRDFRSTDEFVKTRKYVLSSVQNEILELCELSPVLKNEYILSAIDNPFSLDFNDQLIISDAIQNELSVITHDRDFEKFSGSDIQFPKIFTLQK